MNRSTKDTCPICNTQDKGEIVLIGVVGTSDGSIIEGQQFHLKCINLLYDKDVKLIYQKLTPTKKEE